MASLTEREAACVGVLGAFLQELQEGQVLRHVSFRGVSMLPMLRQGIDCVDVMLAPARLGKYDLPIYKNAQGQYVMHRVIGVAEDHYICRGDNTYHLEHVKPEQMVAVVCAFYRGEKRIPVDNPAYRLYARVWQGIYPVRKWALGMRSRIARMLPKGVKQWIRRRLK